LILAPTGIVCAEGLGTLFIIKGDAACVGVTFIEAFWDLRRGERHAARRLELSLRRASCALIMGGCASIDAGEVEQIVTHTPLHTHLWLITEILCVACIRQRA